MIRLDVALAVGLIYPAAVGAQDEWATDFSRHTVPLEEIVSGGPPRDGIPALDRPRFVTVAQADRWIEGREPVILVEHRGDARAYPYQILIWHEIVNDVVGGKPLVITYCPLCNTALVFERRHGERLLDFGTTGRLRHSDLVMYDRQTESWWQQATGEAIVGMLAGEELASHPAQTISWADFKRGHPTGRVLSRDTGHDRPYGRNPYAGYDRGRGPFARFFSRDVDERLPAMERVAAVRLGERSVAYPFSSLAERRAVNDEVDGEPVAVFWVAGTASALDAGALARGRDVGASGVFRRRVDGRVLTFGAGEGGRFVDHQTGSIWDISGRAVAGPMTGTRLQPIPHGDYFWFAWAAFRPDTEIRR
ncbi:MAG TPA: DUF3179 domain-containing protein [Longimicrobiales bacterium]|nr:DUF3179 domain-containing protein [Longimicrobiales bacterium]